MDQGGDVEFGSALQRMQKEEGAREGWWKATELEELGMRNGRRRDGGLGGGREEKRRR